MGCFPPKGSKADAKDGVLNSGEGALAKKGFMRDDYKFCEILAKGEFGNIRKCVHKETKEVFIVKEIIGKRPETEKYFNQVEILKQLVLILLRL